MGSFSYTDALSLLPISAGDPIRLVILKQLPETFGLDHWAVFSPALRGKYDDYGGIELTAGLTDVFAQQAVLRMLRAACVELGPGDNTVHDVEVNATDSLGEFLTGIWERRVRVKALDGGHPWRPMAQVAPQPPPVTWAELDERLAAHRARTPPLRPDIPLSLPEKWPTRERVTAWLQSSNLLVDELGHGVVRVRAPSFSAPMTAEAWVKWQQRLRTEGVQSIVVAGSGSYGSGCPELWVIADPSQQGPIYLGKERTDQSLRLAAAYVREESWAELLRLSEKPENKWDRTIALSAWLKEDADPALLQSIREGYEVHDTPGLRTLLDVEPELPGTRKERQALRRAVIETHVVSIVARRLRIPWMPETHGPQFGEFRRHRRWHQHLAALALQDLKDRSR